MIIYLTHPIIVMKRILPKFFVWLVRHDFMIVDFATIRQKSILLPISFTGPMFLDLLELLCQQMKHIYQKVPIVLVSPLSKFILNFSLVQADFLGSSCQDRIFNSQAPFPNIAYYQSHILCTTIDDYEYLENAIVIYDNHTLDRVVVDMMAIDPENCILLTDPAVHGKSAIDPFKPIGCKVAYLPLSPFLKENDRSIIIKESSVWLSEKPFRDETPLPYVLELSSA